MAAARQCQTPCLSSARPADFPFGPFSSPLPPPPQQGKTRNTAWGCTYRAPPEILHGYDKKVTGKTASERLDLRWGASGV